MTALKIAISFGQTEVQIYIKKYISENSRPGKNKKSKKKKELELSESSTRNEGSVSDEEEVGERNSKQRPPEKKKVSRWEEQHSSVDRFDF